MQRRNTTRCRSKYRYSKYFEPFLPRIIGPVHVSAGLVARVGILEFCTVFRIMSRPAYGTAPEITLGILRSTRTRFHDEDPWCLGCLGECWCSLPARHISSMHNLMICTHFEPPSSGTYETVLTILEYALVYHPMCICRM
jgi:hypothetical protein